MPSIDIGEKNIEDYCGGGLQAVTLRRFANIAPEFIQHMLQSSARSGKVEGRKVTLRQYNNVTRL